MKLAKQQVNQPGEGQPPLSPLQSALNSAANTAQAYETYIENGIICLKHKIRNIEKKKVTWLLYLIKKSGVLVIQVAVN